MKKEHAQVLGFLVKTAAFGLAAYTISHLNIFTQDQIAAEPDKAKKAAMMAHNDLHAFGTEMHGVALEALSPTVAQTYNESQEKVRKQRLDQHAEGIDKHKH